MREAAAETLVDARELRRCLGQFPTGVTIVATETADGRRHGMTASAFLSVSLDPPLALVSVQLAARMHELLLGADHFTVSVLGEDDRSAALRFAGQPANQEIELTIRNGVPAVEPSVVTFVLRHVRAVYVGDHCLHIGQIERWWTGGGDALVHYRGAFRRLDNRLDDVEFQIPARWGGDTEW